MKILIIRNFPSYMDVENNTYNIQEVGLAKALVRKGCICDILFWTDKEEKEVNIEVRNFGYVKVYYRKGKTKLKNTIYTGCDELFKEYDILQSSEYNQIQSWILAKKYPKKTIIYHGPYYSKFNKRYNLMCKVFDVFFLRRYKAMNTKFITKSILASEFLQSKGIDSNNITTIGVGLDEQMLSQNKPEKGPQIYDDLDGDKSELKLLYIGQFEERRNLFFLLDVFEQIHRENISSKLYMIGKGKDEYVAKVRSYIKEKNIDDAVWWYEKVEQKYLSKVYEATDIFLLPTKYEIFGMVLLEAMFYRNVVVTTDNGGSRMLIQNQKTGIVEKECLDDWVNSIINITNDKCRFEKMKSEASLSVIQKYTWDKLANMFIDEYSKLVK